MWKPVVKSKFIDNREIGIFTIFVISMLFLLYPKGKIEKLVLEHQDSNIDLANIYLDNLVKINEDPYLKLLLAKRYLAIKDNKKADLLLKQLENTNLKDQVLFVRYENLKYLYFSSKNQQEKIVIMGNIRYILKQIIQQSNDYKILTKVYTEAVSMNLPDLALEAALKINTLTKNKDKEWLKTAYDLSLQLKEYGIATRYIDILKNVDNENYIFWIKEKYKLAIFMQDYNTAIDTALMLTDLEPVNTEKYKQDIVYILYKSKSNYRQIIDNAVSKYPQKRDFLHEVLSSLYIANKDYKSAYLLYMNLYKQSKDIDKRKKLFKDIVNLLLLSKDYNTLKEFLNENYDQFIYDTDMAKFILKSALAIDINIAHKIALRIKEEIR